MSDNEEQAVPDPAPEPVLGLTRQQAWWRRNWWVLAVVLVVVAGGAVAGVLALRGGDDKKPLVDPDVLITARQEAINFFTLDYTKADADTDRVLALATGTFKQQYQANKASLVKQLQSKKLVTTGTIPQGGSALEYVHGDSAQVLVVIDVARSNAGVADSLRNRARVLLTKVDGHWLVSGVNQVG